MRPQPATAVPGRRARALGAGLLAAAVLPGLAVPTASAATRPPTAEPRTSAVALAALPGSRLVGLSRQGRPVTAERFGTAGASRTVVVIGLLHGNEPAGVGVVARLRAAALRGQVPRGVTLWLVTSGNPDGLAHRTRTNAAGVDLNRNFPDAWVRTAKGSGTYSGPSAASEPETRALLGFLARTRPDLVVVFHQPLAGVGRPPKDVAVATRLATALGLPVKTFSCGGVCRGTLTGWYNARYPGTAVTVEFGSSVTGAQLDRAARGVLAVAPTVADR